MKRTIHWLPCFIFGLFSISIIDPRISFAIDEFKDLKMISSLPLGEAAIAAAHRTSAADACETVEPDESLEISSFTPFLTRRDKFLSKKTLPIPSARHSVLSIGLEMDRADERKLPMLSGNQIIQYIDDHFVIVQARVRRDLLDRKLYYHHRPLAVTAQFRGVRVSQKFEPVIVNSVKDFHSLGLFRSSESPIIKPEQLRTIVLVFKNSVQISQYRTDDKYELAFVHGRESKDPDRLDSHLFITDKDRSELLYLQPFTHPSSVNSCNIRGNVEITGYDRSGIFPTESVTKSYQINSIKRLTIDQLEKYATMHEMPDGWDHHVNEILDAIVDGKL